MLSVGEVGDGQEGGMVVPWKTAASGLGSDRMGESYVLPWDVRREMREGETVPAVPQPGDWLLEGREAILRNTRLEAWETKRRRNITVYPSRE